MLGSFLATTLTGRPLPYPDRSESEVFSSLPLRPPCLFSPTITERVTSSLQTLLWFPIFLWIKIPLNLAPPYLPLPPRSGANSLLYSTLGSGPTGLPSVPLEVHTWSRELPSCLFPVLHWPWLTLICAILILPKLDQNPVWYSLRTSLPFS